MLRWVVMPRVERIGAALPIFIVGLATAEACGFLGIFLGGARATELFALGRVGELQWLPLFAGRFVSPNNSGSGFRG